jgi:hypothetical protein
LLIAGLLNAFWVLPVLTLGSNPLDQLGEAYNTVDALKFFSFAKFENSLSLLHPNWPENIFGKTFFMRPEFLLIPLIAFSSLFFVKNKKTSRTILFFTALSLLGAFLGKGSNEPFGFIYVWLFENLPGFVMFRDSTKWYLLTALSYCILIPFAVYNLSMIFKQKLKITWLKNFLLPLVFIYMLILIMPALKGEVKGLLRTTRLPEDYKKLEIFLSSQKDFFRILWVPEVQRFAYYSSYHPPISSKSLFKTQDNKKIISEIKKETTMLSQSGVKYIIVPYDSHGEIFIKDRKYDKNQYINVVDELEKLKHLRRINRFGDIAVFELPQYKDRFWSPNSGVDIEYEYINPSNYKVSVRNAGKDLLIFSEAYNKNWVIKGEQFADRYSKPYGKFNSFELPRSGDYSLTIEYKSQRWVDLGLIVSGISLIVTLIILIKELRGKHYTSSRP